MDRRGENKSECREVHFYSSPLLVLIPDFDVCDGLENWRRRLRLNKHRVIEHEIGRLVDDFRRRWKCGGVECPKDAEQGVEKSLHHLPAGCARSPASKTEARP